MNIRNFLKSDAFWLINKSLLRGLKNPNAAVLLSFLIDKEDYYRGLGSLTLLDDENEYFFATSEDIEEDIGLSYRKQKTAIKVLGDHDLIKTELKGCPARLHFAINHESIFEFVQNRKSSFPQNRKSSFNKTANLVLTKGDVISKTNNQKQSIKNKVLKENSEFDQNKYFDRSPSSLFELELKNEVEIIPDDEEMGGGRDLFGNECIDKERGKKSLREEKKREMINQAKEIIDLLNLNAGRKFKNGDDSDNIKWILQLRKKVGNFEDIKDMVLMKCWEWSKNDKMRSSLRPITIFKRHGKRYVEEMIEAKENPQVANMLKKAKEIELGKGVDVGTSKTTFDAMETLKNW